MRRGAVLVAVVVVAVVGLLAAVEAKLIVHPTHPVKHVAKDVESVVHVNAVLSRTPSSYGRPMDLEQQQQQRQHAAQHSEEEEEEEEQYEDEGENKEDEDVMARVQELPEQTLPVPDPHAVREAVEREVEEAREDDAQLANEIAELPEQNIHFMDLEEGGEGEGQAKGESGSESESESEGEVEYDAIPQYSDVQADAFDHHAADHHAAAVLDTPGVQVQATAHAKAKARSRLAHNNDHGKREGKDEGKWRQKEGEALVNPLRHKPRPPIQNAPQKRDKLVVADKDTLVQVHNDDFDVSVAHVKGGNFLDATKVQIGTAELGARSEDDAAAVAKFRVRFADHFTRRPVVLVSVVPGASEGSSTMGPHPDVFAATVAEIALDSFVVNIVRVDQFAKNNWGQHLLLDWVAMEYNTDYPHAKGSYPNFERLDAEQQDNDDNDNDDGEEKSL